jgi:hypothetical protein
LELWAIIVADFIDLTVDSPANELAPTQFEGSLPERRVRDRTSNVVVDDVIEISTPVKKRR